MIEPFILFAILLAALASFVIGWRATSGWRAAVVAAAFLPALFVVACFVEAGIYLLLIATGAVPVE